MSTLLKQYIVKRLKNKGYFVEKPMFSNPLPEMATLKPNGYWERPYPCHGLNFQDDEYHKLLQDFVPYSSEIANLRSDIFDPNVNRSFLDLDLEILYSMVRLKKPKKIVEVGCGWSSIIIRSALDRNFDEDGHATEHIMIEPYPAPYFLKEFGSSPNYIAKPIQDVGTELFSSLGHDSLLFIDTSHISKYASDVNYLYFYLLPAVKKGCQIHIHDIFLPYEYPKEWMSAYDMMFNEQYLLLAFLMFNDSFRVQFPAQFMAKKYPKELASVFPRLKTEFSPGSMWLNRVR